MDAKTIAAKRFERGAFGSYKATDVDVFINEVADYVKKLEKEHDDLLRDLKILADKTEEYRESEDAVQEALVKAQKYGNKIINDAKIEAEEIDSAAKAPGSADHCGSAGKGIRHFKRSDGTDGTSDS